MKKTLLTLLTTLLLAGCALEIRTTGYADRGGASLAAGGTFAVLSNAPAANPLLDREVKGKIEKLLLRRGYRLAAPDKAGYHLTFGYGIQPGLRSGTVTTFGPPQTEIRRIPDGRGGVTTSAVTVPGATSAVPVITVEYDRQVTIRVTAAPGGAGNPERVLWIGESASLDPSSDLRSAIDYLLVATFDHFGRDTGRQVQGRIAPDHPDLKALREGTSP